MLIPLTNRVDESELTILLGKHFPEIKEEIEEDNGLVHIQIGALERLASTSIEAGNFEILKKAYEFVSDLVRHQKEVDSNIINAINVSFLEGLNFQNKNHGEVAKGLLPPILLSMWEAQMEHNRKIGWLK